MPPWLVLFCVPNCVSLTSCVVGADVTHHFPHLIHCIECQIGFTYISKENEIRNTFENSVRCHICFWCLVKGSHLDLLTLGHHLTVFLVPQEPVKRRSAIGLSTSGYMHGFGSRHDPCTQHVMQQKRTRNLLHRRRGRHAWIDRVD